MPATIGKFALEAVATVVFVVVANLASKGKKQTTTVLGLTSIGAALYLASSCELETANFYEAFTALSSEARFAVYGLIVGLSVLIATGSSPDSAITVNNIECPASSDSALDFEMPANVPVKDKELFEVMFKQICAELIADLPTTYEMPAEPTEWIKKMINYTVAGGKMNRGLAAMSVNTTLAEHSGRKLTDKDRCKTAALGWCIEFLQAFFLVADDIMDASILRRGQDCWYRCPEVKLIAINDSFILESFVYKILKRYYGRDPYYPQLLDLFIEVTRQTELGQLMDLTAQPLNAPIDLERFTMERLTKIFKYKTAFYSFYLPVALAMIQAGITDRSLYAKAREILCIMGEYFQIQDDFLDCYGTKEQIGKIGTDIKDNKCCWMVVTALSKSTKAQKAVLVNNYGKHDDRCEAAVKKLYNELNLKADFEKYEEESYSNIQKLLDESTELPRQVFEFLLNKIYKRSK